MPRYSVIIPVYKVEEYLSACVDSVLAQNTSSDYEVILVDDGSPDRCGAICDDYAVRYPNVRVIHQENKGLSGARNTGLAEALGEYVIFLDSDDLWEPNLLSVMDTFVPHQPDMVKFCFERFDESGYREPFYPAVLPSGERGAEYIQKSFSAGQLPPWSAWTYLYRRAFLMSHGFRFTQGLIYTEDMDFNMTCLPAAERVMGTDNILLRYRVRPGSITAVIPAKGLSMHMQYAAKWFRVFPVAPFANYYTKQGLTIAEISDLKEQADLTALYFQNKDVLSHSTGKIKLAYLLLRTLGIPLGTKVFFLLVRIKQCLCR